MNKLVYWTQRAEKYYKKRRDELQAVAFARYDLEYHKAIRMIAELEACEHTDYEETLDGTIWHRVCIDCGKVTEIETKDIPW